VNPLSFAEFGIGVVTLNTSHRHSFVKICSDSLQGGTTHHFTVVPEMVYCNIVTDLSLQRPE